MAILTGGCQCGAIRYALEAMPSGTHICHCRMCQKAVGGPFAALAPVRLEHFRWTRGTAAVFASSNIAYRHYCRDCGTPLSFGYNDHPLIDLTIGSLDEPGRVAPVMQYAVESRVPWCNAAVLDGLPVGAVTRQGDVVSNQHPDGETP